MTKWLLAVLASTAMVVSAVGIKAAESSAANEQLLQMQKRMEQMQQQMDRIRAAKDPKERDRLLDEHIQTMQQQLKQMRGMGGRAMMGMSGAGGGMHDDGNMSPEGREQMMQNRMDMMQMMMEQMMNQLQILQGKVHGGMHGQ